MSRAQALVELAVCAPVVALLALGAAAVVRIADAESGLVAATQAAVAAAARAPDPSAAQSIAAQRFAAVVAAYPVRDPVLTVDVTPFAWGARASASSSAAVDVGWAGLAFARPAVVLHATASAPIEAWRTHR